MVVVVNRLRFAEARPQLRERFLGAPAMDQIPGCVGFEFWEGESEGEYLVVTRWQDRVAFQRWTESEAFRHAHSDTSSAAGGSSEISIYEVLRS